MEGKETIHLQNNKKNKNREKTSKQLTHALYEKLKRATIPLMDESNYKVLYSSCIFEYKQIMKT
jgi:hypothetical protein